MTFPDHFSRQSGAYTQFRPRYPRELFEHLASLPATRELAWDCGTGNGQAAVDLAEWFQHVIGTDASANQLAHALPHPRVEYLLAAAEHPPIESGVVDLITVAQAVHWFNLDRFYAQVRRVSRRGAVLAVWSYGLAYITPEVDRVVHHLYEEVVGSYWPPERKVIEQRYETIAFPFEEFVTPAFDMRAEWTLADLVGYLSTWSSVQAYISQHNSDPVALVNDDLAAAWGDGHVARPVHWPLYMRVGRVG
jgi:ubiquinone/menaquinone biosynthesis C-methylase UbiE